MIGFNGIRLLFLGTISLCLSASLWATDLGQGNFIPDKIQSAVVQLSRLERTQPSQASMSDTLYCVNTGLIDALQHIHNFSIYVPHPSSSTQFITLPYLVSYYLNTPSLYQESFRKLFLQSFYTEIVQPATFTAKGLDHIYRLQKPDTELPEDSIYAEISSLYDASRHTLILSQVEDAHSRSDFFRSATHLEETLKALLTKLTNQLQTVRSPSYSANTNEVINIPFDLLYELEMLDTYLVTTDSDKELTLREHLAGVFSDQLTALLGVRFDEAFWDDIDLVSAGIRIAIIETLYIWKFPDEGIDTYVKAAMENPLFLRFFKFYGPILKTIESFPPSFFRDNNLHRFHQTFSDALDVLAQKTSDLSSSQSTPDIGFDFDAWKATYPSEPNQFIGNTYVEMDKGIYVLSTSYLDTHLGQANLGVLELWQLDKTNGDVRLKIPLLRILQTYDSIINRDGSFQYRDSPILNLSTLEQTQEGTLEVHLSFFGRNLLLTHEMVPPPSGFYHFIWTIDREFNQSKHLEIDRSLENVMPPQDELTKVILWELSNYATGYQSAPEDILTLNIMQIAIHTFFQLDLQSERSVIESIIKTFSDRRFSDKSIVRDEFFYVLVGGLLKYMNTQAPQAFNDRLDTLLDVSHNTWSTRVEPMILDTLAYLGPLATPAISFLFERLEERGNLVNKTAEVLATIGSTHPDFPTHWITQLHRSFGNYHYRLNLIKVVPHLADVPFEVGYTLLTLFNTLSEPEEIRSEAIDTLSIINWSPHITIDTTIHNLTSESSYTVLCGIIRSLVNYFNHENNQHTITQSLTVLFDNTPDLFVQLTHNRTIRLLSPILNESEELIELMRTALVHAGQDVIPSLREYKASLTDPKYDSLRTQIDAIISEIEG